MDIKETNFPAWMKRRCGDQDPLAAFLRIERSYKSTK